jgi:hypothetical protein
LPTKATQNNCISFCGKYGNLRAKMNAFSSVAQRNFEAANKATQMDWEN